MPNLPRTHSNFGPAQPFFIHATAGRHPGAIPNTGPSLRQRKQTAAQALTTNGRASAGLKRHLLIHKHLHTAKPPNPGPSPLAGVHCMWMLPSFGSVTCFAFVMATPHGASTPSAIFMIQRICKLVRDVQKFKKFNTSSLSGRKTNPAVWTVSFFGTVG